MHEFPVPKQALYVSEVGLKVACLVFFRVIIFHNDSVYSLPNMNGTGQAV
jgi:hypothetical protein